MQLVGFRLMHLYYVDLLIKLTLVIGAAAGISAGFNVLITGFIYTTEELTRTLSRKVARAREGPKVAPCRSMVLPVRPW